MLNMKKNNNNENKSHMVVGENQRKESDIWTKHHQKQTWNETMKKKKEREICKVFKNSSSLEYMLFTHNKCKIPFQISDSKINHKSVWSSCFGTIQKKKKEKTLYMWMFLFFYYCPSVLANKTIISSTLKND